MKTSAHPPRRPPRHARRLRLRGQRRKRRRLAARRGRGGRVDRRAHRVGRRDLGHARRRLDAHGQLHVQRPPRVLGVGLDLPVVHAGRVERRPPGHLGRDRRDLRRAGLEHERAARLLRDALRRHDLGAGGVRRQLPRARCHLVHGRELDRQQRGRGEQQRDLRPGELGRPPGHRGVAHPERPGERGDDHRHVHGRGLHGLGLLPDRRRRQPALDQPRHGRHRLEPRVVQDHLGERAHRVERRHLGHARRRLDAHGQLHVQRPPRLRRVGLDLPVVHGGPVRPPRGHRGRDRRDLRRAGLEHERARRLLRDARRQRDLGAGRCAPPTCSCPA